MKVQMIVALVITGAAQLLGGAIGLAALIGAAIAAVSNALFALGVFGGYRAQAPGDLLFRFFGAELLKLVLVAMAFAATFAWVESLNIPVLFGVFLVVQILPPLITHATEERMV